MREILFRGKGINKGKWIEGFLFPQNIDSGYCPLCICSSPISANDYSEILGDWSIVSEDTIGQYTGLTDKNGKKIFEGDIVESILYGDMYIRGVVKYMDARYMIVFKDRYYLDMFAEAKYSILGNVHDNPELVEDKP